MKIGVLQTGEVRPDLVAEHGHYPAMFERLFRGVKADLEFQTWRVLADEFPAGVKDADLWLITGSRHGVYENLPWMLRLQAFIREAYAAGVPLLGICFGHQIMAQALGGRVEKSAKGWGLGVQAYDVTRRPDWLKEAPARVRLNASHQDQVVVKPADATVLAESEFCPYALLAYGPPESPRALSIQAHPEFDDAYTGAIIDMRHETTAEARAAARATLGGPLDAQTFAAAALKAFGAASA